MNNVGLNRPPKSRRFCSSYNSIKSLFYLLACLVITVTGHAVAAETPPVVTSPTAPPVAPREDLEPQVTITQNKDEIIEEYRINNQLYMIKVTPRKGYAYYLVDTNGDGRLDTRKNELAEDILIPSWTLLRWK
jgi:Protein of unknown function (DUF2782)